MAHDLMHFLNLDPEEDIQETLRLALMFKEEVDEATRAYMEMIHISVDHTDQSPHEVNQVVKEAINAALITGIRAYRSWIESQGVNVKGVEASSGKDIPPDLFHKTSRYPL